MLTESSVMCESLLLQVLWTARLRRKQQPTPVFSLGKPHGQRSLLLFSPKSCQTLCNPMDCSTPDFPVLHHLHLFVQIPLSQWCNLTISSSAGLFLFCLQSFPASGSFPMSGLFASVQFSRSVLSDSWQPHEPQHARPPCPSPTPGHPNSCPLSWWCHPTSHPLSSPVPPALNLSQHQGVF